MITKEQEEAALPFVPQIVAWAEESSCLETARSRKSDRARLPPKCLSPWRLRHRKLRDDFPDDEITLVQGMIDLWFVEENEKVVLIDFKTAVSRSIRTNRQMTKY